MTWIVGKMMRAITPACEMPGEDGPDRGPVAALGKFQKGGVDVHASRSRIVTESGMVKAHPRSENRGRRARHGPRLPVLRQLRCVSSDRLWMMATCASKSPKTVFETTSEKV